MSRGDYWYHYLLREAQSADPQRRLSALEDLRRQGYVDRLSAQFLLDRLNSTSDVHEQERLLSLMYAIKEPLPTRALMTIITDEAENVFLRMNVAHTLAAKNAEGALDLFVRLIADEDEHPWLREALTSYLASWKEQIQEALLLSLLTDPVVCHAALEVFRSRPAHTIPLEMILPYCTHEKQSIREEAIKTLLATEQRVPIDAIFSALDDPEPEVRAAASYGCIQLAELFGGQLLLEPLLKHLFDDYSPVRENLLDALGKVPLHVPVEPVVAALADDTYYVRCAALETLALMGERVPSSVYPLLQHMSGTDPSAQVRLRAIRTLLLLRGIEVGPLRLPVIEIADITDIPHGDLEE